jgi:hypothetical protein
MFALFFVGMWNILAWPHDFIKMACFGAYSLFNLTIFNWSVCIKQASELPCIYLFRCLFFVLRFFYCFFATVRVITKLSNSEQSSKGKVNTHKYINRQNQSTTGILGNRNDRHVVVLCFVFVSSSYFI